MQQRGLELVRYVSSDRKFGNVMFNFNFIFDVKLRSLFRDIHPLFVQLMPRFDTIPEF